MRDVNIPFLSIVIPVYRVEKYIKKCINSIIKQSFQDYELILVNDGSDDNCPLICDEYADSDIRVKVIHKENGGLSDARNAGIHASCGHYLIFVDGDDFIHENSLVHIIDEIKNDKYPDIMFLNAMMYYEKGHVKPYVYAFKKEDLYGASKDEVLYKLSSIRQFHVSACMKAIKKEFLVNNKIFFTKGIIGEDVDFSIKLYLKATTYSYLDYPYYYYRQERTGSIMAQKDEKRFNDLIFIIRKWVYLSNDKYVEDKYLILRFLYHQYYMLLSLYQNINKSSNTKKAKAFLNRFSYLLKYTNNKKAFIIYILYKICGLNFTSYFINRIESKQQVYSVTKRFSENIKVTKYK